MRQPRLGMKESFTKRMDNYKATPFALLIYAVWWIYVVYFLYFKAYDNNAAGATASIGIGSITLLLIIFYLIGFTVAIFRDKPNRKLYILSIILTLSPIVMVLFIEYFK